jgi:iron complex transport system ATP-binding protein
MNGDKTAARPLAPAINLEVRDLGFAFGKHQVLRGVSFTASSGQAICLLGHNGAGKSTLFRCLLGLLKGFTGEILLDGEPTSHLSRRELSRRIAYIPQSSDPVFDYSVFDVVMAGRTVHLGRSSVPTAADEDIVFEQIERLGISNLATRGYAHISGGERQMVLIARALAQQARILVMAEPTANLDFGNQYRVLQHIQALREEGYLVILSTHNPQHAMELATRVLVLHEGRILAQGAPLDVLTPEILGTIYGIPIGIYEAAEPRTGNTRRFVAPQQ